MSLLSCGVSDLDAILSSVGGPSSAGGDVLQHEPPPAEEEHVTPIDPVDDEEEEDDTLVEKSRKQSDTIKLGCKKGEDISPIKLKVSDLCNSTGIFGATGSGKSYMIQHLIETVCMQAPSIKNINVFDYKGDFSQMIVPGKDQRFESVANVNVFSVASDFGIKTTLDPFKRTDPLYSLDPFDDNKEGERREFIAKSNELMEAMLLGTISIDKNGNPCLEGGFNTDLRKMVAGERGMTAVDRIAIASKFIDAGSAVIWKCKLAGNQYIPTSYEHFLFELKQLTTDRVGGGDFKDAPSQVHGMKAPFSSCSTDDLAKLADEIEARAAEHTGMSMLFRSSRGKKPLDETVLLASAEESKTNINIINLALLGDDTMGISHKKAVTASVLRTIRTHAPSLGGTPDNPSTMLVIDEASELLPKTASNTKTGYDMSSITCVESMMKVYRSKGVCVVLATQAPGDLNPSLLKLIAGTRLIGKCRIGSKTDVDALKFLAGHASMGKASAKKEVRDAQSEFSDALKEVPRGEFLVFTSASTVTEDIKKIRAPKLKRKRENESEWLGKDSKLKEWYTANEDGTRSRVY